MIPCPCLCSHFPSVSGSFFDQSVRRDLFAITKTRDSVLTYTADLECLLTSDHRPALKQLKPHQLSISSTRKQSAIMAIAATRNQIIAMATTERVSSVFSLMGILFILSTFALGRGFDKPINRLIFLASWSNLGMNIATLIAEDGPVAGQKSALCQFQAFAIQM